jgi:D-glycero-D-manno-heptose 1,7-bisphosphate phosphatase
MKRPAVFFDRDNTLIVSNGYLGDPAQVKLIPGAADLVATARRLGYATVVVSNQSGVARGMFTEEDVDAVNRRMEELLRAENPQAVIERHEYCPFHPEAPLEAYRKESDLRKPKPGMILRAAQEMDLSLATSWMIGDAPRDMEAGVAAGCRTILFTDQTLPTSPAAEEPPRVRPDFTVGSLAKAAELISSSDFIALGDSVTAPSPLQLDGSGAQAHGETLQVKVAYDPKVVDELNRIHAALDKLTTEVVKSRPAAAFSVARLLAGIVQVAALACLVMAVVLRLTQRPEYTDPLMWAAALQLLTIGLLLMGRDV